MVRCSKAVTESAGYRSLIEGQRNSGVIKVPGAFEMICKELFSPRAGGSAAQGYDIAADRSSVIGEDVRERSTE